MKFQKLLTLGFAVVMSSAALASMPTGDLSNDRHPQPGAAGVITGTTSGDTTDGSDAKPMADTKAKKSGKMKSKKGMKKSDDAAKAGSDKPNTDSPAMDSGMSKNQ